MLLFPSITPSLGEQILRWKLCRYLDFWADHHGSLPDLEVGFRQWRIHLQCRRPGFSPWVGKIPWGRERLLTPVFLPGKSHGQGRQGGYSPWGHKQLDTTEQLTLFFSPPLGRCLNLWEGGLVMTWISGGRHNPMLPHGTQIHFPCVVFQQDWPS